MSQAASSLIAALIQKYFKVKMLPGVFLRIGESLQQHEKNVEITDHSVHKPGE